MNWLKERREELRLTQEEITNYLQIEGIDISRSGYAAWESERNPLPLRETEFRVAIAKVLRLSESEILKRSGFDVQHVYGSEAERAADIIESLPPERQKLALRVLEQFVRE